MRARSWLLAAALAGSTLVVPDEARGNGRPPLTNGVFFRPGDTQSIYIRATFGLLISHDDGCTFRWVCEQAIGYGGEFDPKYAIANDGTIFATTFEGVRVTRDNGCTWMTAPPTEGVWVDAIDIGPDGDVWIATAETAAASDVYRSTNNGVSFERRGMHSPNIWWKSVKVAPSDPQRVYVSGYQVAGPAMADGGMQTPMAHLLRSDNGGDSWAPSALANVQYGSTPVLLVAAVDPANADHILVTSVSANPPAGARLYRSTDAGATLTEVLVTTDAIRDVVFHGDRVFVATLAGGTFVSADNAASFQPLGGAPQLGCLGRRGDQLIGCGANWDPDFKAVARSIDDGASWDKVWRFVELAGPLDCPAGTPTTNECAEQWPALQGQFGAKGPTCGANVVDGATDAPDGVKPPSNGCCDAGGSSGGAAALLAGLVALGVVGPRRRRP